MQLVDYLTAFHEHLQSGSRSQHGHEHEHGEGISIFNKLKRLLFFYFLCLGSLEAGAICNQLGVRGGVQFSFLRLGGRSAATFVVGIRGILIVMSVNFQQEHAYIMFAHGVL